MRRATAVLTALTGLAGLTLVGNALAVHTTAPDRQVVLSSGPPAPPPSGLVASPVSTTLAASATPTTPTTPTALSTTPTTSAPPTAATTSAPGPSTRAGRTLTAYITAYTWYDNDPPGPAIADPVLHRTAGGTGTYADPVTLAVADGRFSPGTRLYLPHVRRYFIVEDTCASCGARPLWLDMWIDGRNGERAAVQACAERLTGDFTVELGPPAGRPVDPGTLFGTDGCYAG